MNPLPDSDGTHYWMPLNMQTVERALEPPKPAPVPVLPEPEEGEEQEGGDMEADDAVED